MKTITECHPLIYGLLKQHAERRKMRQRRQALALRAAIPIVYVFIGLAIVFDAGIVPWDLRFWLIFSPFFLFGERVLSAVTQARK